MEALSCTELQPQPGQCLQVTSRLLIQECGLCTCSHRDGEIVEQVEINPAIPSDAACQQLFILQVLFKSLCLLS